MMVLARYGNAPSARAALVALAVIAPIGWIGLFEGVYNHAAKLLLYAAEPNGALYQRLFPNDSYELPEDWVFEATGILQILPALWAGLLRSEEHTSELQSLMRISYAVFCLKKKTHTIIEMT